MQTVNEVKAMLKWRLDEGLKLIRALQGRVKEFGYHIALGGSVLNNGDSEKDLDLYFLPFDNLNVSKEDTTGLLSWLTALWGEPWTLGAYSDVPPEPDGRRIRNVLPHVVSEDEPMPALPIPDDIAWVRSLSNKPKVKSSYQFKLKFQRAGNDRIDVFII